MMEEDNLGDTNRPSLTHPEVDGLHSENCKLGQKAGSIYRTKNKEQEIRLEPRADMVFGNLLMRYTAFLAKQGIYRNIKVVLSLGLLT